MSHAHRDENQLADVEPVEVEPTVITPVAPTVANTEAERRAAERRKLEGAADQVLEHQFTGDMPEPSRGGTESETRLILRADGADEDDATTRALPSSRRGPPPPRHLHVDDHGTWLNASAVFGAVLPATQAAWATETSAMAVRLPAAARSWGRR